MGEMEKNIEKRFNEEYIRSIQFAIDLVDVLKSRFGSKISDIADSIASGEERRHWAHVEPQKRTDTYIRKTQFTINLLEILKNQFGPMIVEVLIDLVAGKEREHWTKIAQQVENHTIEDFIHLLWAPLPSIGFEFTIEQREDGTQMSCSRCPIYDLAQATGGAEWLYLIECGRDFHNVSAFNPKIGFRRTKTLMEGHDCCDHFYFMRAL